MSYAVLAMENEGQMRDNAQHVVKSDLNEAFFVMNEQGKKEISGRELRTSASLPDLIKRSREGDTLAMEAIYLQFKRPVFNLAYRFTYDLATSEDLLQDIFLKIFTHLEDVKKEETFSSWLFRIALNTCYSYLRQWKSRSKKIIPLSEIEGKIEEATYDSSDRMMKKPLDDAIQSLPGKLKSVFVLHDVQGFKHEEIAQTLGWSVGTSKSQLFKARIKIRQYLKNKQMV